MTTKGSSTIQRGLAAVLVAVALAMAILSASPVEAKYAAIVIDADSGRVLHSVNADTRNYPASLVKMMTLYLVFEALEGGRLALGTRLPVSARSARQPASRLGLRPGQTITVKQAILAMVTKSANDVAAVVAEALSGSQRDFALVMTATARRLGMSRTTFRNPSGLPHRGQMSTARDMAVLARRLLTDFPRHYHYFSTPAFTYAGITHRNHNKLLTSYKGADGIKTGYIRASGFNLVASARRHGHRLIGVIFGGSSPKARNRLMAKLLDKGFGKLARTAGAADDKRKTAKTTNKATAKPSQPNSRYVGQWAIQVGAYKQYGPAYRIAVKVVAKLPDLLGDGTIKVVPLKKRNGLILYRARILGLAKKQAYKACRILKQRRMDCMEVRLKGVQVASSG